MVFGYTLDQYNLLSLQRKEAEMKNLHIQQFELGPIGTNAFLLWEEGGHDAILVDAPPDAKQSIDPILKLRELRLSALWLTHGHWDHMAGAWEFAGEELEILGHKDDLELFDNPQRMANFAIPGLNLQPVEVTRWIEDGESFTALGRKVLVAHCPGHCPGNVSFYLSEESRCFVGDVIFSGSIGRTDLPGGDFETLENSIRKNIYTLPDETILHSGHGPDTTVTTEKGSNPFVRP